MVMHLRHFQVSIQVRIRRSIFISQQSFFQGMPFHSLYPPGMVNQSFRPNLFNPFGIPIPTPGVRPQPLPSASSSSSTSSNRHHQNYDGSPRKYDK
jgi:hypothetical protein